MYPTTRLQTSIDRWKYHTLVYAFSFRTPQYTQSVYKSGFASEVRPDILSDPVDLVDPVDPVEWVAPADQTDCTAPPYTLHLA